MAKGRIDLWLSRSANVATFWTLAPAGAVGVIAAILSRGVAAIDAYGPFGWLMAGLVAFLLFAAATLAAGLAFDRFASAMARRKWSRDVDSVNPLDPEFHRKRLKLSDLVHPLSGRIKKKRFVDCQLLGPANLAMVGNGQVTNVNFANCDIVIVRDEAAIFNGVMLQDVEMIGGEILKCTVYVSQAFFDATFANMPGVNLLTYLKPEADHD